VSLEETKRFADAYIRVIRRKLSKTVVDDSELPDQKLIAEIIMHNQAIHTCMKQGIVDFHASQDFGEIEKSTAKHASINTIVVVKRSSNGLKD
jgi:hypothetical protein